MSRARIKAPGVARSSSGVMALCCVLLFIPGGARALDPGRTLHQYNSRNWTRQNGLPVNGVNAITQTRDGFIWLGTHNGLVRFDGVEFVVVEMPSTSELRSYIINCLTPGPEGGLWFGLKYNAYGFYDGREGWAFGRGAGGSMEWQVNALVHDGKEGLLVAGLGLTGWRDGEGRILPVFDGTDELSPVNVSAAFADSKGRYWLGTVGQGLYYLEDGRLMTFPDPGLREVIFCAIAEADDGGLWIGTTAGLRRYNAEFEREEVDLPENQVNTLLLDSRGSLWIGTADSGIARWKDGQFEMLRESDGLVGDSVLSLAEDHEGSIWIGCREGLSQLSDVKLQTLSAREGLSDRSTLSVSASPRGGLWVASAGGIKHLSGWRQTQLEVSDGPREGYTKRVFEASDGDLYVIGGRNEIEIYTDEDLVARHETADMPVAMTEDAAGMVVSVGGRLFRVGRHHFRPFDFVDGLEPELWWVLNLLTARDGTIWVACGNGVFQIREGRFKHWTVDDGHGSYTARWVVEDKRGTVWVATPSGIGRVGETGIDRIGREQGLFDANLYAMIPDDHGQMWVDSARGLFRVALVDLNNVADGRADRVECAAFDDPNSVQAMDRYDQEFSACRTADGLIWFPSQNGVILVDPANVASNPVAPRVRIHHIHADGADVPVADNLVIPPGRGELEISYTALTFISPQKARFRYRLDGLDAGWVEAGERRLAYYSKLKPGRYTFQVTAANADGVWNETGDRIEIELQPHLHQTAWFKAVAGLVVVGGLTGFVTGRMRVIRNRQRRLEKANELLENRVRDRTRELAEQRNMLRALIDNLPDNVFVKDAQCRVVLNNVAHAKALGAATPEETVGKTDQDFFPEEYARKYIADEQAVLNEGRAYDGEEISINRFTGRPRWTRTTKVPLRDGAGNIIGLAGINRDITEGKEWEAKLEAMHKQLLEASRKAGMAEVATSVLHNVGNVLNSVNTSASVIAERVKHSKVAGVARLAGLLEEHRGDLAGFLKQEGRAEQVIGYLNTLVRHLGEEQGELVREVRELSGNIEHIKEIVVMQQSYAKVSGVTETVSAVELVEDSIRMNSGALNRHGVELVKEYEAVPAITVEKHKVLQVLVNLIRNAKYACDESGREDKKLTIRVKSSQGCVRIEVEDNGVGIPRENLTRIFSHGFTTRKNGHGFGLHSGSLAAQEMGGELRAHSEGPGRGATFTLVLPIQREETEL